MRLNSKLSGNHSSQRTCVDGMVLVIRSRRSYRASACVQFHVSSMLGHRGPGLTETTLLHISSLMCCCHVSYRYKSHLDEQQSRGRRRICRNSAANNRLRCFGGGFIGQTGWKDGCSMHWARAGESADCDRCSTGSSASGADSRPTSTAGSLPRNDTQLGMCWVAVG